MANLINTEALSKVFKSKINDELIEAAKPIIEKAVAEAEREMKKALASFVVSFLEESFMVERYGHDIRIIVKHDRQ